MDYEVTIGIPLYNAERFIRRSLESALAQTFTSIEYLIVDDCSTDHSIDIVREIQTTHRRGTDIRIVRQPHNMGVGSARNRIIDEAHSSYIFFMDSDDIITPDAISIMHSRATHSNAQMVYGSYEKTTGETQYDRTTERHIYPDINLSGDDKPAEFAVSSYFRLQGAVWNCLFSKAFLQDTGTRFPPACYGEDTVFTYILITQATRVVLCSDVTYYYICREGSLSNYQSRGNIAKAEVLRNVATAAILKEYTARLSRKSYLGNWCYMTAMTDFYMICSAISKKDVITPRFSSTELRDIMTHPLTLKNIMQLKTARIKNIALYALSKMPPMLFTYIISITGKRKGLI